MKITITAEQASSAIHELEMRATEIDLLIATTDPRSPLISQLTAGAVSLRRVKSEIEEAIEHAIDADLETKTEMER